MKKVICNADLAGYFTKGKSYEIIHNEASYAIIRDDNGMPHGLKKWKSHFNF